MGISSGLPETAPQQIFESPEELKARLIGLGKRFIDLESSTIRRPPDNLTEDRIVTVSDPDGGRRFGIYASFDIIGDPKEPELLTQSMAVYGLISQLGEREEQAYVDSQTIHRTLEDSAAGLDLIGERIAQAEQVQHTQ